MRTLAAKLATGSLLGLLALSSACVDNDVSVIIRKVQPVTASYDDATGMYECTGWNIQDGADIYCIQGTLDIGNAYWTTTPQGAPFYTLVLLVDNFLPNNAQPEIGQLDTHKVRIDRVEVSYRWDGNKTNELLDNNPGLEMLRILEDSSVSSQYQLLGDYIESSGDGIAPGSGLIYVEILPADVGQLLVSALSGQSANILRYLNLEMRIKLVGRTTGGMRVESASYSFVINFCEGCLGQIGCMPGQSTYSTECVVTN